MPNHFQIPEFGVLQKTCQVYKKKNGHVLPFYQTLRSIPQVTPFVLFVTIATLHDTWG